MIRAGLPGKTVQSCGAGQFAGGRERHSCPFSFVVSGSRHRELLTDIFVESERIGDPTGGRRTWMNGAGVSMILSFRWALTRQVTEPPRPGAVVSQDLVSLLAAPPRGTQPGHLLTTPARPLCGKSVFCCVGLTAASSWGWCCYRPAGRTVQSAADPVAWRPGLVRSGPEAGAVLGGRAAGQLLEGGVERRREL